MYDVYTNTPINFFVDVGHGQSDLITGKGDLRGKVCKNKIHQAKAPMPIPIALSTMSRLKKVTLKTDKVGAVMVQVQNEGLFWDKIEGKSATKKIRLPTKKTTSCQGSSNISDDYSRKIRVVVYSNLTITVGHRMSNSRM